MFLLFRGPGYFFSMLVLTMLISAQTGNKLNVAGKRSSPLFNAKRGWYIGRKAEFAMISKL